MHWNYRWQAPLYAALLLSFIACNHRSEEGKKDLQLADKATASQASEAVATDSTASPAYEMLADEQLKEEDKQQAGGFANANHNQQQAPRQPQRTPDPNAPSQAPAAHPDWDKKIIKTGTLTVEVENYAHFDDAVRSIVKQSGGYVAKEEQSQSDYKKENEVTIKVPVDQFDNMMSSLSPAKEKILVRRITSQDVTGEVVDTRSRLEAKKAMRLRYLDLLKQARNMEEVLQVQNEINSIQENIESASGRINYLTHSSAYSTIQLTYYQVLNAQARDTETPPGFGQRVLLALGAGLSWIGEALVLALTLWPLLIVLIAVFIAWKKHKSAKPVMATTQTVNKEITT